MSGFGAMPLPSGRQTLAVLFYAAAAGTVGEAVLLGPARQHVRRDPLQGEGLSLLAGVPVAAVLGEAVELLLPGEAGGHQRLAVDADPVAGIFFFLAGAAAARGGGPRVQDDHRRAPLGV